MSIMPGKLPSISNQTVAATKRHVTFINDRCQNSNIMYPCSLRFYLKNKSLKNEDLAQNN